MRGCQARTKVGKGRARVEMDRGTDRRGGAQRTDHVQSALQRNPLGIGAAPAGCRPPAAPRGEQDQAIYGCIPHAPLSRLGISESRR